MSDFNLTRARLLSLAGTVLVFFTVGSIVVRVLWPEPPEPTVEVVHWSNTHLMREGLLPVMAEQFNEAGHSTESGKRIVVNVFSTGSGKGARDLISRATHGVPLQQELPDPVIFTPHVDHWLVDVNYEVGRVVVDLNAAQSIARSFIGIVTYRDMAECLGWPEKEFGCADIIALRADPQGWARYECAKSAWGQRPLVSFTDPTSSSTGRSVLFTLYSIAAGKPPEQLKLTDVTDPVVIGYVKQFQRLVDHYMFTSIVFNTKIHQGPRFGHFFLMAEDNLIHLKERTASAFINGVKVKAPPISPERPMVMIYPKEGSTASTHCACIIDMPWVTPEHVEAAQKWVAFLHEDTQQRTFMAQGFRPVTDLSLTDPAGKISGEYGLDPTKPTVAFNPSRIDPAVAAGIDDSWEFVKRPGIVTLVVDTSGSMMGDKLKQAKDGTIRFVDNMASNNQVGLVTFDDTINFRIPVAPRVENRFEIADAVQEMRARGETALYDAIKTGIEMTDAAEGEVDAIRAVVVLTDGRANRCSTHLDDLIHMTSRNERRIQRFTGCEGDPPPRDVTGEVKKEDVIGTSLATQTRYPIQVFFIGIGEDADMQVGRMLAEATGAEFQGVTAKDLANVLEKFSKYF